MPKYKFIILYIGLLPIVLLYTFTATQYIEGRASRKKKGIGGYLIFLIITELLLHVTMLCLKYSH